MNNIIKAFEEATERKCFETYRRCLDSERINQSNTTHLIEYL